MAENDNIIVMREIGNRGSDELSSLLQTKTEELHKARFKHTLGQLGQTHTLRSLRRDIARLKTVLQARRKESQV